MTLVECKEDHTLIWSKLMWTRDTLLPGRFSSSKSIHTVSFQWPSFDGSPGDSTHPMHGYSAEATLIVPLAFGEKFARGLRSPPRSLFPSLGGLGGDFGNELFLVISRSYECHRGLY